MRSARGEALRSSTSGRSERIGGRPLVGHEVSQRRTQAGRAYRARRQRHTERWCRAATSRVPTAQSCSLLLRRRRLRLRRHTGDMDEAARITKFSTSERRRIIQRFAVGREDGIPNGPGVDLEVDSGGVLHMGKRMIKHAPSTRQTIMLPSLHRCMRPCTLPV